MSDFLFQAPNAWSLSNSLTLTETSQCENTTLIELDSHFPHSLHRNSKASGSVLSFSRPKALLSRSEELQARMNLMHLQKVLRPNILSLFVSIPTPNFRPSSSKCLSSKQSVSDTDTVFRPSALLRLKRRPSTDPNKRRKNTRTDENLFRESAPPADDGFPSLKAVLDQLIDAPSDNHGRGYSSAPSSGVDDDDSSDDNEAISESESLFGDNEFMQREVVGDATAATGRSQSGSQARHPWRPLNSIRVVNWTNAFKRFDYLLQNGKMDWRCDDELYELLKTIDVEKDNITIELLKKTRVGKMIRDLSKCDKFEERSRIVAKKIYRTWLKMCRDG